tara:strand:- start:2 stop:301 length:300 start_codon:yes stop_codon:yes gene_type:complete
MVTIWTLQHPAALTTLRQGKPYRASKASVEKYGEFAEDWEHFGSAYRWMENQYRRRVGPLPKIEQTWERIFQRAHLGDYLQCVLAEIRPADVVQTRLLR